MKFVPFSRSRCHAFIVAGRTASSPPLRPPPAALKALLAPHLRLRCFSVGLFYHPGEHTSPTRELAPRAPDIQPTLSIADGRRPPPPSLRPPRTATQAESSPPETPHPDHQPATSPPPPGTPPGTPHTLPTKPSGPSSATHGRKAPATS